MLTQPTIEKLCAMRLRGMAEAFQQQQEDANIHGLSFEDRLGRVDLLVVDDWAMAPMSEPERRDFLEICDTRYQARSTLLTSQLPVAI